VILLPGLHLHSDAKWRFEKRVKQNDEFLEHGPVKFLTVKSGFIRCCYIKGKIHIFTEGRYAINDYTFLVGDSINIQQQNVRFDKHPVLLDGGIKMEVEGLLTYQVDNPEKVVQKIGAENVLLAISNISKAELSRIFATVHMEQISSSWSPDKKVSQGTSVQGEKKDDTGNRNQICAHVIEHVQPIVEQWGVTLLSFQIEKKLI